MQDKRGKRKLPENYSLAPSTVQGIEVLASLISAAPQIVDLPSSQAVEDILKVKQRRHKVAGNKKSRRNSSYKGQMSIQQVPDETQLLETPIG